ncbi:MAG: hypothetical protein A3K19_01230 [Lentisphaerae bacterium RIFOXYB12_FULL_65_16]|nr:MAG: hypothetical protein A3K18_33790 [Lentisphaerae bacterium RIFOXYA12_64_32]OGV92512.1 MAG: hypothetical protein A3K19_01230 [Lentisphaerae bacterium RIFOXYB12_FULL_65_16]
MRSTQVRSPQFVGLLVLAALGLLVLAAGCSGSKDSVSSDSFELKRGQLQITVSEAGQLEAAESVSVVCETRKPARILEVVSEGTTITEEDVKSGRVLIKLDSVDFEAQLREQQSNFESAKAGLTEAQEAVLIQESENQTNIRSAELALAFAITDLRKLAGDALAEKYAATPPADIATLPDEPGFGGQALQDLGKYQSEIELEKEEYSKAQNRLNWTKKLFDRGYVTADERDSDALALRRRELSLETAKSKLDIFRRYDFVKEFQRAWSGVLEAREKLDRAKGVARSKLAQSQAQLNSRQGSFIRVQEEVDRAQKDIDKCTIRATKPGLVTYQSRNPWDQRPPIKVGTEVQVKETLLQIPDLAQMVVTVKIHEAQIDQITPGQTATVKIDALPGRNLAAKVATKGAVPNTENRWWNPDLKVYDTRITIEDKDVGLRPGMTATVEILCETLNDVLYVPIQAVATDEKDNHYCYRQNGNRVPVTVGKRNRVFVVVTEGLKEGEVILMNPPELASRGETKDEKPAPDAKPGAQSGKVQNGGKK